MTDHQPATDRTGLRIERVLPAPAHEVFNAWTDPATMARWLSPTGRAQVDADVRVGGALRVLMLGSGVRIDHAGEYLEVDPPRKLVFTWRSVYTGDAPSVVTVVLTPQGGDTHLLLTHEQLPGETVTSHQGGWGAILDNLATVFKARGETA